MFQFCQINFSRLTLSAGWIIELFTSVIKESFAVIIFTLPSMVEISQQFSAIIYIFLPFISYLRKGPLFLLWEKNYINCWKYVFFLKISSLDCFIGKMCWVGTKKKNYGKLPIKMFRFPNRSATCFHCFFCSARNYKKSTTFA